MSGAIEGAKVPKLRFPGFEGEWVEKRLESLVDKRRKITYGIVQPGDFVDHGVYLVRGGDYSDGWTDESNIMKVTPEIDLPYKRSKLKEGDLLLTIVGANTGTVAVVPPWLENANITQTTARVAVDKTSASPGYIEQILKSRAGKREVYRYLKGAAQPGLNLADVEKFRLTIPPLPEQQKIADFLGAVEARVRLLGRRRDALVAYKKGLMQRLFSRTLRFTKADGSPYPDWKEKRLGEVGQTIGGLAGKSADDFGDGLPYVTYRQVFGSSVIDVAQCELVRISANERQNQLRRGDILFTTSSETPNEVGFASVISNEVDELYLNSFCFALRPFSVSSLQPEFAQYLFRSPQYRRIVYPLAQGSTRYNLSKGSFLKLILNLPHPEEQQKIADALTALDGKIDAVTTQIATMQRFKKSLLQMMFV